MAYKKTQLPMRIIQDVLSPTADVEALKSDIAINSYYRSEARGFVAGYELHDWLAAKQEMNSKLGR